MAITAQGTTLTSAHTVAQRAIQRRIQRDILTLWALMDPADLEGSAARFSRAATAIIAARKRESAALGAAYYRAFRAAEGVDGPLQVALMADLAREQAETVLRITGPVTFKVARRNGHDNDIALRKALLSTIGAGQRLVAQGGRDTIDATIRRDSQAVGYARVTRGDSCAFCAMLASRGPVFKSAQSASSVGTGRVRGNRRVGESFHDNCDCQTEAVFDTDSYSWPGGDAQRALSDLWDRAKSEAKPGENVENVFRRLYERPALNA